MLAVAASTACRAATFSFDYTRPTMALRAKAAVSQTLDAGVIRRVELQADESPEFTGVLSVGDELDVRLFDNRAVKLVLTEQTPTQGDRAAFLATADGYDGQAVAAVVLRDGKLQIDVQDYLAGRVYSVFASAERTVVKEMDPVRLPCRCGAPEMPAVPADGSKAKFGAAAGMPSFELIDILVVYDTMAASWAYTEGGGPDNFAEVQVQKMNAVLANTGLDQLFRFRLVGVYEVGGSAGGSIDSALQAAQRGTVTLNGVSWSGVGEKRDEVEADIVCVLVDNYSTYGTTGLGYSLQSDSGDFSEYAYNACLIRSVAQSQTMTHEVGHNMGAGHATAVADEGNRGPQYFSCSSGYYFTGADGVGYHTIMAYNNDGYGNFYTSAPYFSSPEYMYKSTFVGDVDHDNTFTLRETYSKIARYRGGRLYSDELGVGTESEDYVWETSPEYPWYMTADDSIDGIDSVRSCEMSWRTESWMQTCVAGPATLTFAYMMRTYTGAFTVTCDGKTLFERAGEDIWSMDWTRLSLDIPAGSHVVRFAYAHPSTGYTEGWGNGVRIDRVVFDGASPAGPEFTVTPDGVLAKADLHGATHVEIPAGVKSIAPYVFACDSRMASVKIPAGVTDIGEYAFAGCSSLVHAELPVTLRDALDSSVFHRCAPGFEIAYYSPRYAIRFHRNDASDEKTATYEFVYGVGTRLPSLSSLGWARRGFDFRGWATSAANAARGVVWKGDWGVVSDAANGGGTKDVYAVWALKAGHYAIYFVRNDGAGTWRTVGFQHGEKTRMPSLANGLGWARRGYEFKGWELTTSDANDYGRAAPWKGDWAYVAEPTRPGQTLTVYARWALRPGYYQIRFNRNDGSERWRTLGFQLGTSTKLSTIAALGWERPGYTFVGWGSDRANATAGRVWKTDGAWVKDAVQEGRTLSIYSIWE